MQLGGCCALQRCPGHGRQRGAACCLRPSGKCQARLPPQVREIYEMAVEAEPPYSLSDGDCKTMCVRYAQLETRVRPDQDCT
jgi:hypothetical protein